MDNFQPSINQVRKNVARKSTSNRPLKQASIASNADSDKSGLNLLKSNVYSIASSSYSEENEESDGESGGNSGVFSISESLIKYFSELNSSPPLFDNSLKPYTGVNHPVNQEFTNNQKYKYSIQKILTPNNDTPVCRKSEPQDKANETYINDDTSNGGERPISSDAKDSNARRSIKINNEEPLNDSKGRFVRVLVREEFVIFDNKPMKMTVLEAEELDIDRLENNTDETDFHNDCPVDEADFQKVICDVSLKSERGGEIQCENFVNQGIEADENQNWVPPARNKRNKRKNSSNTYCGARRKKTAKRRSKFNPVLPEICAPNQESSICLTNNLLSSESKGQEASGMVVNTEVHCQNTYKTLANSSCILNKTVDSSIGSRTTLLESTVFNDLKNDCVPIREKCVIYKQHIKEINEGIHVEAAIETDIMCNRNIVKDEEPLLRDIEYALPIDVKDFDIPQSLTEEILLDQAMRLAHQRTSPRFRPLLSQPDARAILSCLSNAKRYNTRVNNKRTAINNDEKPKPELPEYQTDRKDKNANFIPCQETCNRIEVSKKRLNKRNTKPTVARLPIETHPNTEKIPVINIKYRSVTTPSRQHTNSIFSIGQKRENNCSQTEESEPGIHCGNSLSCKGEIHSLLVPLSTKIGSPIPSTSEVNSKYSVNVKLSPPLSKFPVKRDSRNPLPSSSLYSSHTSTPTPLSTNVNSGFSSATTVSVSGFTPSIPNQSISPVSSEYNQPFTIPLPNLPLSSSVPNFENSRTSLLMSNCEVKAQEKSYSSNSAPIFVAVKPKVCDIPLSIATSNPRLRNKSCCIVDSELFDINHSTEKHEHKNTINLPVQKTSEEIKNTSNNQTGIVARSNSKPDLEKNEFKNEEIHNEIAECDKNKSSKKQSRKKEIDQELLYKTPLSDLHDSQERSSYSRTISGRPTRHYVKRGTQKFRRQVSDFLSNPEYEPYQEHSERHQKGDYYYHDRRMLPDSYHPNMYTSQMPTTHSCEQRNESCLTDKRTDHYSETGQEEFSAGVKWSRARLDRRPVLETPPDFRQRESYVGNYMRMRDYFQDARRQNGSEYRRRGTGESVYPRWGYAKAYSSKSSEEGQHHSMSWEDETEIRDLIEGPMASLSRPFYRQKSLARPWKTSSHTVKNFLKEGETLEITGEAYHGRIKKKPKGWWKK